MEKEGDEGGGGSSRGRGGGGEQALLRLPCVILMPNGADEQQRKREAKVFPLAKAPTLARLLAEASARFGRDVRRVFAQREGHITTGAAGAVAVVELTHETYLDVCSRLPARSHLFVSCGEDFARQPATATSTNTISVQPEPLSDEPRTPQAQEHREMQDAKTSTRRSEDEKEEERSSGEEEQIKANRVLVCSKKVQKAEGILPSHYILKSKKHEVTRSHSKVVPDKHKEEFLTLIRQVRLSAPQVKSINWSEMALSTLPDWHQNWTAIEEVQLQRNNLSSFPMRIVEEHNFRSITSLNLSYNRIPSLPEEFILLRHLKSLKLVCNLLTSCYPTLLLPSLTDLDLSENLLNVISGRDILVVNSESGSVQAPAAGSLTRLSLNSNLLEALPIEMEYLTSLRYLYVKDNPLKPPLHKLNNAGNQAIMLHFLVDLLSDSPDSPSVNRNRTLSRSGFSAGDAAEAGGLAIIPIEELDLDVSSSPLGRGAHGVVWRGTYKGQSVAVKNVSSIAKFCQEVGILSSLKLKYCIKYHGVCVVSGITLVVMEHAPRGDLARVLKELQHKLTLEEKLRIALKVAKGMEELHKAGIIHCDLKATNIVVFDSNPWKVKLTDFGLSTQYKINWDGGVKASRDATMYFPCTAPEVLENGPFSMKSDVYAYAMFLYELFTGRKPFKGLSIDEIVRLVVKGSRPSLELINAGAGASSKSSLKWEPPPDGQGQLGIVVSFLDSASTLDPLKIDQLSESTDSTAGPPCPLSPSSPLRASASTNRTPNPAEVREILLKAIKLTKKKKDFVGLHEINGLLSILDDITRAPTPSRENQPQAKPQSPRAPLNVLTAQGSASRAPIAESIFEKLMERARAMLERHSGLSFTTSVEQGDEDEPQEEGNEPEEAEGENEAKQEAVRHIRRLIEQCWSPRPHQRPSFSEIVYKVSSIYWKGSKEGSERRTSWITRQDRQMFALLCKKPSLKE